MVVLDNETYHNASSAAKFIGITRFQFYTNVKGKVQQYKLGGSPRCMYKQSELEPFRAVEAVTA